MVWPQPANMHTEMNTSGVRNFITHPPCFMRDCSVQYCNEVQATYRFCRQNRSVNCWICMRKWKLFRQVRRPFVFGTHSAGQSVLEAVRKHLGNSPAVEPLASIICVSPN